MELNPPERTEPLIPTAIAWESVASAASDAAALPLSQQAAEAEAEEAPAGKAEIALPPEEPEPEPDAAVPPGLYAHLGLLYSNIGDDAQARAYFDKEAATFPESRAYIELLLSRNKAKK